MVRRSGRTACAAIALVVTVAWGGPAQARPVATMAGDTLTVTGDGAPADLELRPVSGGTEVVGADAGEGCSSSPEGASCPTTASTALAANLGAASETLRGAAPFASAMVSAGAGDDTITWTADTAATLLGGPGADRLVAEGIGFGAITADGGDGDDRLEVGLRPGSGDTITGGDGRDLVSYAGRIGMGVSLTLDGAGNDGALGERDDLGSGLELLLGSPGDDVLIGSAAGEMLDGGAGSDELIGGAGMDTFAGGGDGDTISYDDGRQVGGRIGGSDPAGNLDGELIPAGIAVLRGTPADDELISSGPAQQRLEGLAGNDRFTTSGPVPVFIDGGPGAHDELRLNDPAGVSVRLSSPGSGTEVDSGDTWRDLEDLAGSPGPDTADVGLDTGPNVLRFGDGDLVTYKHRTAGVAISPGFGADDGAPGEGDDVSAQIVEGSGADDSFDDSAASRSPNEYDGIGGDDTFLAAGRLEDGATRPQDTPRDVFDGADGVDTLRVASALPVAVSLVDRTGSFNDVVSDIENVSGGEGDDTLIGDDGVNALTGNGGNDTLKGLGGADTFPNGPGADAYGGGDGEDAVDYGGSPAGVAVTPGAEPGDGAPGENDDVAADVERVIGSPNDDTLALPPSGRARLEGGAGRDTLDASGRVAPGGLDLAAGEGGEDRGVAYLGFEDLIGTPGPDVLSGDVGVNELRGNGGDDRLDGGPGADVVLGGVGADELIDADADPDQLGGSILMRGASNLPDERAQVDATRGRSSVAFDKIRRDDRLIVDTVDPARRVTVDLVRHRTDLGDVLADIESVAGTRGDDRLVGDGAENTLIGNGGADTLIGGGQNDRLVGGPGNDLLRDASPERDSAFGDEGNDSVILVDAAPPANADAVRCGNGRDAFSADLEDQTSDDCETLLVAPVGEHPLTRVHVLSRKLDRRARVRARVSCPLGVRRVCRGTLSVERGARRNARRAKILGARHYRVRAGRSQRLRVELSPRARRRLARRGRLPVRLAAREADAQGRPRESSVPVVLRRR
jgi:Ca2+-binding RTX toxin-like protein